MTVNEEHYCFCPDIKSVTTDVDRMRLQSL